MDDLLKIKELEKNLGLEFKDKNLLLVALTHRSWVNENKNKKRPHNERIEFLGDAVLELVVTEFLFKKFPDLPEGVLTAYRAALVNTQALSSVAKKLRINDFLFLSKGEAKESSTKAREHILANTLEAIIGAVYLDKGFSEARNFIEKNICSRIDEVIEKRLYQDPKNALQEFTQEKFGVTPVYELVSEEGPDHQKTFEAKVMIKEKEVGRGKGTSKQEAERQAARDALDKNNW